MLENWEYTWDTDDLLERHEPWVDNIPKNYPHDWSDKKWLWIWHQHAKFLREKVRKEKEQSQALRLRVASLVDSIAQKKQLLHTQALKSKTAMQNLAIKKTWDERKAMEAFRKHKDYISTFSDEQLIYFFYVLWTIEKDKKVKVKKHKQNAIEIKNVVAQIMLEKWIPTEISFVEERFRQIPKENIREYAKSFTKGGY